MTFIFFSPEESGNHPGNFNGAIWTPKQRDWNRSRERSLRVEARVCGLKVSPLVLRSDENTATLDATQSLQRPFVRVPQSGHCGRQTEPISCGRTDY